MRNLLTSAGVACAIVLAFCFAALSAAYWITELAGQPDWQIALAVVASVAVSLMAPVSAYLARQFSWLLIVPALVFVTCDIYQNSLGYQTFRSLTVSSEVEAAQTRLADARADLAALPLPNATGAIRQASTWETLNTTLTQRVEDAKTELTALQEPEAPMTAVAAVMGLIQLALTLFFGCLGKRKEQPAPTVAASDAPNVVYIRQEPKVMDKTDLKAWSAINKAG